MCACLQLHSLELELAAREEKMAAAQRQHDMLRQDLMAKTAELEGSVTHTVVLFYTPNMLSHAMMLLLHPRVVITH